MQAVTPIMPLEGLGRVVPATRASPRRKESTHIWSGYAGRTKDAHGGSSVPITRADVWDVVSLSTRCLMFCTYSLDMLTEEASSTMEGFAYLPFWCKLLWHSKGFIWDGFAR